MFPGVSSLVFSGFGLKPSASGFQSYSYSSLKTSPSVTSKAVPSVLASSVCSLVQSRCGEGRCCKQTTLACACSASATLGLPPAHGPHFSGSRLLHEEPSEAGPGLHAPPRSEPLRFRHSGSLQRCRLGWACILCPSQVRADQVIRCLVSTVAVTYHLPATLLRL